jgi:ubiquinone/menaquinone biosynthesis C-methylase UbiE
MDNRTENKSNSSFQISFINPEEVIDQMDLQLGSQVADFGCGTGYFSLPLAKKLKEDGTVYAIDILKEKLEAVESQAKLSGLSNVVTKRVNLEKLGGSQFADESLDWVIIKDMLFQNKDKKVVFEEAKRVLKPEGKILLVEWDDKDFSVGPKRELRIPRESMNDLINQAGLTIIKELTTGNFHYGLILSK